MEYLTNDTALTNMANAIRTKIGSSSLITYDEMLGFKTAIDAIPTGGGPTPVPALSKGVNFIDYDGTVVEAWQTSEVAGKSALPSNPSHDGLTAQGWNWSLANIKSYIADYPDAIVWVGQMYITSDGKTRVYIHLEEGRLSPYLGLAVNGSVDIDWGDGTAHGTLTGTSTSTVVNTQHTYASGGDYVIALTVTGTASIKGDSYTTRLLWKNSTTSNLNKVYQNAIQKVEIGSNIGIGQYAFSFCYSLASVTIPDSVTSIDVEAFYYCYSLAFVTIPDSVTKIGTEAFNHCYSLAFVTIPDSVTSIGQFAFGYCYSLASVTIPDSMTSISEPAFQSCESLASITIPDSVTNIGRQVFRSCYSLASVTIPDSVTSIGSSTFMDCYGLGFIKFTSTTPPKVLNIDVWSNIPTDCIIYVPWDSLYPYATNYPDPDTYDYIGSGIFNSGVTLPSSTTLGDYTLVWYATVDDAINKTNPITTGNGNVVYCRYTWAGTSLTMTIVSSGEPSYNYVNVPGSSGAKYYSAGTYTIYYAVGNEPVVYCYMGGNTSYTKTVTVNDVEVYSGTAYPTTYEYTAHGDISIAFTGTSYSSNKTIAITEVTA